MRNLDESSSVFLYPARASTTFHSSPAAHGAPLLASGRSRMRSMATRIRIPLSHRASIENLAQLSDERYEALAECFEDLDGDLSTTNVEARVAEVLGDDQDATTVFDALIGASLFGRRAHRPPERVAQEVSTSELLQLEQDERRILADRLLSIFSRPGFVLIALASSLRAEDEFSYCTSRIVSDLRPVFTPSDDTEPIAALIQHSLKFEVHIDGRIQSVLIAVDARGLDELANNIKRAARKAEFLRRIAHESDLPVIDLHEEH